MRWLIRRSCFYLFALWVAITLNFLLPRLMPGDPAGGMLARLNPSQIQSNPGIIETYRRMLGGGHESLIHAYFSYLGQIARLDFGISTSNYPTNVSEVIARTLPYSIFLDNMPIVPLFIGPRWSTYSTKYFHCFASPKNFYGDPIFTTFPDNILSFTRICPGGKAG